MSDKHFLSDSPSGLFTVYFMAGPENLTFYAAKAPGWKFVIDEPGTLAHFDEIAAAFRDRATVDDLLWLTETLQAVETWLETCPHDLERFGEVGVSF